MIRNQSLINTMIIMSLLISFVTVVQILTYNQPTAAYTCRDGTEFPDPPRNVPDEDRDAIIESNCSSRGGSGAAATPIDKAVCDLDQSFLGLPTWYKYLDADTDSSLRCSPTISNINDTLPIGLALLEGLLRFSGIVAVVMIFISGFKFITSQGNPESAKGARETAINALIGLVIIIVSTGVISFVGRSII